MFVTKKPYTLIYLKKLMTPKYTYKELLMQASGCKWLCNQKK